jgi:hypothetical protein
MVGTMVKNGLGLDGWVGGSGGRRRRWVDGVVMVVIMVLWVLCASGGRGVLFELYSQHISAQRYLTYRYREPLSQPSIVCEHDHNQTSVPMSRPIGQRTDPHSDTGG